MSERDHMAVCGNVTEVGKDAGRNLVVVEMEQGQCIRISGQSDTVTKYLAAHLYEPVTLEFHREFAGYLK